MPFKSEKQRRFLWAEHPEIAKRWAHEYPESNKDLPMYAHDKKKSDEKAAAVAVLGRVLAHYGNYVTPFKNSILDDNTKEANSGLLYVKLPKNDKPTYAGQDSTEIGEKADGNEGCAKPGDNGGAASVESVFGKLALVLARPLREIMERQQAEAEGREPRLVPENLQLRRISLPSPYIAPPMGTMAGAPAAQSPAQPQQPQQPRQPGGPVSNAQPAPIKLATMQAANLAPIKPITPPPNAQRTMGGQNNGQKSPAVDAMQMYGPLRMINGKLAPPHLATINGNAAFGQKNSPDSLKTALAKWSGVMTPAERKEHAALDAWQMKTKKYDEKKVRRLGELNELSAKDGLGYVDANGKFVETAHKKPEKTAASWEQGGYAFDDKPTRVLWNGPQDMAALSPEQLQTYYAAGLDNVLKRRNAKLRYLPSHDLPDEYVELDQKSTPDARKEFVARLVAQMHSGEQPFMGALGVPQKRKTASDSGAWTRAEGKSESGGLNAKGRASLKAQGHDIKPPVTESNPKGERAKRQNSFCARMCGMKRHETGSQTKKDPDSRINKSLRKWNCKCSSAQAFGEKLAMSRGLSELPQGAGPDQIADAVMRFNQLRTLVRPPDETLQGHGLSRGGFQKGLRDITRHSQGQERFELSKAAPNPKLHAALAGLAGLAGVGGVGYFGGPGAALAALPVAGAAAGGAYVNAAVNRERMRRTAKLMKQYGLLNPGLLQQAYPLLGDNYKISSSLAHYLPDSDTATRQMAVAGLISAALGGGRSYFDPGYDEKYDEAGNIISRKRRNPTQSALHSAGIGLGVGALGSLASQIGNNWAKEHGRQIA